MRDTFQRGDRIIITKKGLKTTGYSGVVLNKVDNWMYSNCYSVRLDFVFSQPLILKETSIKIVKKTEDLEMEGKYKIAIVNLVEDYNKKDYGFALYDEFVCVGDYVVCNPRSNFSVGIVKNIMTQKEYGKGVQKEIVGRVNMDDYNARIAAKENEKKKRAEICAIQKELESRISKLKDLEYYENMAKELAAKDPELAVKVARLKELSE